uniref:ISEc63 n=1 Tax=Klebsiella pneumoniae TaxID=573 RepID=A0A2L1KSZ5_KLEPN|nr:ISEc63 [Klebsiella pneumoniae]
MFRSIIEDALFRAVQFGQIMNRGQRMFSCRRSAEMQIPQYRRKKTLNPAVLLHHFIMEVIVLRAGKFINLADGFCQPAFRYAAEDGLPQFSIVSLLIQQQ